MDQFWRSYKAEFIKNKHSVFLWMHIGIPIVFVAMLNFICFSRIGKLSSLGLFATFFEMIGLAFPLIIAVLCGLIVNREKKAGHYQMMLGKTPDKITTFISQLCMLLTMCLIAIFIAIISFIISTHWILHVNSINCFLFFKTGTLVFLSVSFLYTLHLTLGYRFGVGACSIVGFTGTIIAALASTGLGDYIWRFLPWVWPIRFSNFMIAFQFKGGGEMPMRYLYYTQSEMNIGLVYMGIMTSCCIIFLWLFTSFWECRQK